MDELARDALEIDTNKPFMIRDENGELRMPTFYDIAEIRKRQAEAQLKRSVAIEGPKKKEVGGDVVK